MEIDLENQEADQIEDDCLVAPDRSIGGDRGAMANSEVARHGR
jgi:hypothetical protein